MFQTVNPRRNFAPLFSLLVVPTLKPLLGGGDGTHLTRTPPFTKRGFFYCPWMLQEKTRGNPPAPQPPPQEIIDGEGRAIAVCHQRRPPTPAAAGSRSIAKNWACRVTANGNKTAAGGISSAKQGCDDDGDYPNPWKLKKLGSQREEKKKDDLGSVREPKHHFFSPLAWRAFA